MSNLSAGGDRNRSEPYRVRLPGFTAGQDIGLGDAVKRVTRTFGIRPCGSCERRADALNRWFVFTRGTNRSNSL